VRYKKQNRAANWLPGFVFYIVAKQKNGNGNKESRLNWAIKRDRACLVTIKIISLYRE
jgi:hypothetical protein